MADDSLRTLTGLYKLVERVDHVVVEGPERLMLCIGLCLPVHQVGLIASFENPGDKLFNHLIHHVFFLIFELKFRSINEEVINVLVG